MAKPTFQSLILAKHPKTDIVPGETFKLITKPILTADDLQDGQVLLETLYISIDPAMRGWIEESTYAHRKSIWPSFYPSLKFSMIRDQTILSKIVIDLTV
jgi:NADPH-dependent curcumin reductase CurA